MEVVILSVDRLLDERYLAGDPGLIGGTGLGEVVDQLLPIVQIAEQVLRLLSSRIAAVRSPPASCAISIA